MSDTDFQRRLRETFQNEAIEHLRAISAAFFELEKTTSRNEQVALIEHIFRSAHTLKGAARLVRERAAEALCHALETALAGVKQGNEPLTPAVLERLQGLVAQLARELNFGPAAATDLAAESDDAARADDRLGDDAVPAAGEIRLGGYVRVPEARLGTLMSQAEELLAAKHNGARRVAQLRSLSHRTEDWNKNWSRLRPHLTALRRLMDQGRVPRDVSAVLQFVDWSQDYMSGLRTEMATMTRDELNEQRWIGAMIDGMLDETKEILMLPASTLLEGFPTFVRETARLQGKEIALNIRGAETEIDRRVLEEVKDAVVHLVRNAIDHGIETPGERRAAGKPAEGVISITVTQRHGGNVELIVADDGAGVDLAAVRDNALRLGLLEKDSEISDAELIALIFHSGFSTRPTASDLSGHGLGLAIVRERAERLGGHVMAETQRGRGSAFRLNLPVTMARFRGVFVLAGGQEFALPSAYVQRVLRLPRDEIQKVKGDDTIVIGGKRLRLLSLAQVLGVGEPVDAAARRHVFVVVINSGAASAAFAVEQVLFEQEVMMKSLGKLLVRVGKVAGATISPTGRLVPVLNAGDLLAFSGRRLAAPPQTAAPAPAATRRKRRILVVEDSITARMLLKNILLGAGYEVRTAVDGVDAMTVLKFESIDAVVADIQMPRLHGFELTKRIRADQALSTLPVILVTSLASKEDRERGVDAGANAYVIKSSFDQSDLLQIIERLLA